MHSVRFKPVYLIGVVLLLTLIPLYGVATDQNVRLTGHGDKADKQDELLNDFERTHAKIIARVKQKTLPPEAGVKADELKIALKKYLIQFEARLEIIMLDARYEKGAKQQKALDEMMVRIAKGERTKLYYLERLKGLMEGTNTGAAALPPPGETSLQNEAKIEKADENKSGTKWRTKYLDIEIEIAPEDISKGDRE